MTRKRKIAFALAACTLAMILGLGAGEWYIRWCIPIDEGGWYELTGDPVLFYQLRASVEGLDRSVGRSQTGQHIRGPLEYAPNPAPGVDRVLWIGDSACFGTGVSDDETAPFLFGRFAQAAGRIVESINLGVEGYNIRQVREVLSRRSREFAGARAIIYLHHENDIINAPWVALAPHVPSGLRRDYDHPQSAWKKLLKRSALAQRLSRTQLVASWLAPRPASRPVPGQGADAFESPISSFSLLCLSLYDEDNRWGRQFRDELFSMADMAQSLKARLIMVYWPTPSVKGHPAQEKSRRNLALWCSSRDIEFLDVTDDFHSTKANGLYADATHPGMVGQCLIAERVWDRIAGQQDSQ